MKNLIGLSCLFVSILLVHNSLAQSENTTNASVANGTSAAAAITISVGIIIAKNDSDYGMQRLNAALNTAGGAIPIALDRLWRTGSLSSNVNFSFVWRYAKCQGPATAGYAFELITRQLVDVLVAPPCPQASAAETLATFYNIPVLLWGDTMASRLVNPDKYKSSLNIMPNYSDFAKSIIDLLDIFEWETFALVYQADDAGASVLFIKDFNTAMRDRQNMTVTLQYEVEASNDTAPTNATLSAIQMLKSRARVSILCFDDIRELRKFALGLFDAGMATKEFAYIIVDHDLIDSLDSERPQFWFQKRRVGIAASTGIPDGRDDDAWAIGKLAFIFHLDLRSNTSLSANFTQTRVLKRTGEWPFGLSPGANMSAYAPFLHDLFYLYGTALARLYNESTPQEIASKSPFRDGFRLVNYTRGTLDGVTGSVRVNASGFRRANFALSRYYLNGSNTLQVLLQVVASKNGTNFTYLVDNSSLWLQWGGVVPLAVPICGFDGSTCQASAWAQFKEYFILGGALILLAIVTGTFLVYYIIRTRMEEIHRLDAAWRISFAELTKWKKLKRKEERSAHSLTSGPSQQQSMRSGFSNTSLWNQLQSRAFTMRDEKCVAQTIANAEEIYTLKTVHELRMLRHLDHENTNRFVGICADVPLEEQQHLGHAFALWRYCPRGSLRDIMADGRLGKFTKDAVFVASLVTEVVEGLHFLHGSPIQYHGRLHPSHCLLDQNWKLKLTQFGLIGLKGPEKRSLQEKLWLSPELLRQLEYKASDQQFICPSAEELRWSDIYALALLLSELVNGQPCWEADIEAGTGNGAAGRGRRESNESAMGEEESRSEALLAKIRRGGVYPKRPTLDPQLEGLKPGMLLLIRDCWKEEAKERPKIETIRAILRQLDEGINRRRNVMDHVFGLLEGHAARMESEVEERTRELAEEKLKADTLLSKLLPREVANRLKLGESVAPEHFDCASVLFSDLVAFTQLTSRLSPLGTVNVISQLFGAFDAIIEEHDAYKVETIGDGYLCVSGLPRRNGNEHCRHIADMALKFVNACAHFDLPELIGEKIRLRVGIHTGPVVAGVVGLTMPRYCLFGDTVNTASRMESNSIPDRVQLSPESNRFLTEHIGGYRTESRGEVIIKGKGVMETFWLLGYEF